MVAIPTSSAPRVCAVLTACNNALSLPSVIRQVSNYVRDIIVVNDGSTDSTAEALKQFPELEVVTHPHNRGKGAALAGGIARAAERGFTHAISLDGDGRYRAEALPAFLEAIAGNPAAIVIGVRELQGDEPRRRKDRRVRAHCNFWVWAQTGQWVHDTQSGFRAYPVASVQALLLKTTRYEYETELLVKAMWAGIPLAETPVRVEYAPKSESHFRPLKDFRLIAHLNMCLFAQRLLLPGSLRRIVHQKSFRQGSLMRNAARAARKGFLEQCAAPREMALGLGVGVCFGILPIWGFQTAAALLVAHQLRLSKVLAAAATNVSFPAAIPFILYASLLTGRLALTGHVDHSLHYGAATAGSYVVEYLVGSVIFAVASGSAVAVAAYGALRALASQEPG
jgi:uncharacterized protein (DUF2062 family)